MHWKIEKGKKSNLLVGDVLGNVVLLLGCTKNIQRGTMIRTPELKRYDCQTAGLHEVMVDCGSATSAVYPVLVCDLCRFNIRYEQTAR